MKGFYKIVGIAAISLCILGGCLFLAGYIAGGRISYDWRDFRRHNKKVAQNIDITEDIEQAIEFGYENEETVVTEESGSFINRYENVESLEIDINSCHLFIEEGDSFQINADGIKMENLLSEVQDGVWTIQYYPEKTASWYDYDNKWSDNWENSCRYEEISAYISITVPSKFQADNIAISLGNGYMEGERLSAKSGTINIGAGMFQIDELELEKEGSIKVETGTVEVEDISAKNLQLTCGVGHIEMEGKITGSSSVDCGIGEIILYLEGKKKDYNYMIQCGIGQIGIAEEGYSNLSFKTIEYPKAKHDFNLSCGVGNIELNFDD